MKAYLEIEMPKSCWNCTVERQADCDVWRGVRSSSMYKDRRYENCPLVVLPSHGRLIDADALKRSIYDYADAIGISNMFYFDEVIQSAFENAPTIIPASGGQEDE